MTQSLIAELAEGFWAAAGLPADEARDLAAAIPMALPLAVIIMPAVSIARIEDWMRGHDTAVGLHGSDRRLRGGLVAHSGHGIAFVDGTDPEPERRFTLAHEVAHFLLDYLYPRQRAIQIMGDGIAEVLDGFRAATARERTDAALAACQLGVYVKLLERRGNAGAIADVRETRANRLAWELLAPSTAVGPVVNRRFESTELETLLCDEFHLPAAQANGYAQCLLQEWGIQPSFVERLSS